MRTHTAIPSKQAHTITYTRSWTSTHAHTLTRTQTHNHTRTHAHAQAYAHARTLARSHARTRKHTHTSARTHTRTYTCTDAHMYTHAFTRIKTCTSKGAHATAARLARPPPQVTTPGGFESLCNATYTTHGVIVSNLTAKSVSHPSAAGSAGESRMHARNALSPSLLVTKSPSFTTRMRSLACKNGYGSLSLPHSLSLTLSP